MYNFLGKFKIKAANSGFQFCVSSSGEVEISAGEFFGCLSRSGETSFRQFNQKVPSIVLLWHSRLEQVNQPSLPVIFYFIVGENCQISFF